MCYHQYLSQCVKSKTHPHLTLLGPLLELDSLFVEPLDGSFEVIDSHTNMSETFSNIIVSGSVSLEGIILFCSSASARCDREDESTDQFPSCGIALGHPPSWLEVRTCLPWTWNRCPVPGILGGKRGSSW
jgi:hypothetical protein